MPDPALKYSIVIATYNRAADLRETLNSLACLRPDGPWEVIVVDNNSRDDTRAVVEEAAVSFPGPVRYLFEREQGRSAALNCGIRAATGAIIVTTDDDVRVPEDWLNRAAEGLTNLGCDYVGGRVLPIWGGARPEWLPDHGGKQWAVVALLDYGPDPIEFGTRVPLGVNMAFKRSAFEGAGLFDPHTGRRAGTLLGQEVREWCIRARKAGLHGFYVPELSLRHIIPAERLNKRYFRRWFYWRGISRALLYERSGLDMEAPEQTMLDFTTVPHIFGVPRYLYRKGLLALRGRIVEGLRGRHIRAFEHELWLCFFVGIVRQRFRDRARRGHVAVVTSSVAGVGLAQLESNTVSADQFMQPRKTRPLRIALVAPSMGILGGQAVQADRLLRAWNGDSEVTAWLVPVNPQPPGFLRRAVEIKYARTVATQLCYWPLLVRELQRADIVHVFSASYFSFLLAPLPAVLIAKLLGKPVVMNYRSGEAPDHLERSAMARRTLRWVERNAVPSRFLKEVFAGFGIQAEVIPNIVDADRFRFRARDPLRPKVLSTRNFEPLYNVSCTLRAFRLLQDRYPEATLTLVGAGSEDQRLRDLARELRLEHVRFVGRVAPEDIWRYYSDADIYLQTPDIDNMPSSVLEAFASGCAVVSTNAGGVPAILTNEKHGLLVECGDYGAAAERMLRLLADPVLAGRLSAAARESCADYQWNVVRSRWLALYESMVRPRGPVSEPSARAV